MTERKNKMNIMVFDTETVNLEKPFCYNIGYVIYNTETGESIIKKDYVVEQVWHNPMLFTTAYYADKRELYVNRMRARQATLDKFGYITQAMYRDIREHEVQHAFAYNSDFDERVFTFNCDWFKCINPFDSVQIHDIRGHVHRKIAFTSSYQQFCDDHGYYTESGNYSTTAEDVYRYIVGDTDFIEEHTALADSEIELEILLHCVDLGAELTTDYKVYRTIPKTQLKDFLVIDSEGTTHSFQYTTKRKIPHVDGVRLTIKRDEETVE